MSESSREILTGPSLMMKTIMLVTPKLPFSVTHPIIMKTKNPRLDLGDDEFTFFRLNLLLKEVEIQKRLFNPTQAKKEQKKADDCLRYLMNHQPHQLSSDHEVFLIQLNWLICLVSAIFKCIR